MVEMGKHSGDDIVYILGVTNTGVAWATRGTAFRLRARGTCSTPRGTRVRQRRHLHQAHTNAYLLTPPEIFRDTALPGRSGVAASRGPITRGEFLRQPALRPDFYIHGHSFVDEVRSQIDVKRTFSLTIRNPKGNRMAASLKPVQDTGPIKTSCTPTTSEQVTTLTCQAPHSGQYKLVLFSGPRQQGNISSVGTLKVNVD